MNKITDLDYFDRRTAEFAKKWPYVIRINLRDHSEPILRRWLYDNDILFGFRRIAHAEEDSRGNYELFYYADVGFADWSDALLFKLRFE